MRYDRDMHTSLFSSRRAFTLLEFMLVVVVLAVLLLITIVSLRPVANFQKSRNEVRRLDLAHIADAIAEYSRDEGMKILLLIPTSPSTIEICGDSKTGSCTSLLSLTALLGTYLRAVPVDPNASDAEHSRYFVEQLPTGRVRYSAPDVEPNGNPVIEIFR